MLLSDVICVTFNGVLQSFFTNSLRRSFLEGLYIVRALLRALQSVTL